MVPIYHKLKLSKKSSEKYKHNHKYQLFVYIFEKWPLFVYILKKWLLFIYFFLKKWQLFVHIFEEITAVCLHFRKWNIGTDIGRYIGKLPIYRYRHRYRYSDIGRTLKKAMSYIHNRISLWRAYSCFLVIFSSFILDFCKQFAILQILDFVSNLQKCSLFAEISKKALENTRKHSKTAFHSFILLWM